MTRVLTLCILCLLTSIFALSGCAVNHLKVDYDYKGQAPLLSKGGKVLTRCEVSGLEGVGVERALFYVDFGSSAICLGDCDKTVVQAHPDFRHAWGTQFERQLVDSLSKCGFKPIGTYLGVTPNGDIKPLLGEARRKNIKYILYAKTNILLQTDRPSPFNFLLGLIFMPKRSTLTMRVRNEYSLIDSSSGGIIFQKYYTEANSRMFKYYIHNNGTGGADTTEFYREYIRARNDSFSELQNQLIEKFWLDMQTAKLII